jgi:hypothetical protein
MKLADLKLHIENMYDQLDPDVIDNWDVSGLEITVDGKLFVIHTEAPEEKLKYLLDSLHQAAKLAEQIQLVKSEIYNQIETDEEEADK